MELLLKYFLRLSYLLLTCQLQITGATNLAPQLDDFQVEEYKRSCELASDCDISMQLKCIGGECNCPQPDITVFLNNSGTAKCYIKSGRKCNSDEITDVKTLDCVPNSACSSDGFCVCINGTFQTDEGVCLQKRDFFDQCNSTSQCKEDKGLYCNEYQYCECDSTNFWIRGPDFGHFCEMLAGHGPPITISEFKCVANAQYNNSTGKCECNPGFKETKYGICVVPFGETCDDLQLPCAPEMSCINGRCQCHFRGIISVNGTCYSKPGEPCRRMVGDMGERYWKWKDTGFLNDNLTCTSNAICSPNKENSNLFECQCDRGYLDVDGECQLDHNEFCGRGKEVQKCDQSRGLQCIDSICQCPAGSLQYFDYERKYCRGLVGASCVGETEDESAEFCAYGAHCVTSSKFTGRSGKDKLHLKGRCKCKPGYGLYDDRTCFKIEDSNSNVNMAMF